MKKVLLIALLMMFACSAYAFDRVGIDGDTAVPFIGFKLNKDQVADVGLSYSSTNNGATTTLNILGKLENNIMTMDQLKLFWAGQLLVSSASGATTLTLDGIVGAEYKITKNLGIYGNIDLFTLTSTSGATSFGILAIGNANVYSGMRIYLD